MNGLLLCKRVLRTSTAFPDGIVVVSVVVEVVVIVTEVVVGKEVGSRQSKPLQGQPAEQFSLKILFRRILCGAVFFKKY